MSNTTRTKALNDLRKKLGLRYTPYEFTSETSARSFAGHCIKPHWVVLGDNDGTAARYWVVVPADAAKLEAAGYALA